MIVATAESLIFARLFASLKNYENVNHVIKYIGDKLGSKTIYFHPSRDKGRSNNQNIGGSYYKPQHLRY